MWLFSSYRCILLIKVSQKRNTTSTSGGTLPKQEQDDDQRSTSSREDETLFNSGGEPSPNLTIISQNLEKGTLSNNDRRGRSTTKKARLSSTTSTTSTTSTAALKDLVSSKTVNGV